MTTLGKAGAGRWMPRGYNTYHNAQPDANPCSAINKGAAGQNHNSGRMRQHAASAQHTAQSSLIGARRQTTRHIFTSLLPASSRHLPVKLIFDTALSRCLNKVCQFEPQPQESLRLLRDQH